MTPIEEENQRHAMRIAAIEQQLSSGALTQALADKMRTAEEQRHAKILARLTESV